jgi:hypothetical protein
MRPTEEVGSPKIGTLSLAVGCVGVAIVVGSVTFVSFASGWQDIGMTILLWAAIAAVISGAALLVCGGLALGLGIRAVRRDSGRRLGIAGAVIGGLSLALLLYYLVRVAGAGFGLWTM